MLDETQLLALLADLESFRVERMVSTTDTAKFSQAICAFANDMQIPKVADDPNCLSQLKHYRSLMPLAMEAHKPMFHLKPADGAIGAHVEAVTECAKDFLQLASRLAATLALVLPDSQ